jgi:hypothetical protein
MIATLDVHLAVTCMGCHRNGMENACQCGVQRRTPGTLRNVPRIEVHIRQTISIRDYANHAGFGVQWLRVWNVTRR